VPGWQRWQGLPCQQQQRQRGCADDVHLRHLLAVILSWRAHKDNIPHVVLTFAHAAEAKSTQHNDQVIFLFLRVRADRYGCRRCARTRQQCRTT